MQQGIQEDFYEQENMGMCGNYDNGVQGVITREELLIVNKRRRAFENPDLQGQEYQDFQDFKVRVIEEATEIFDIDSLREKLKAWTEEFWPRFRNVKQLKGRQYDETAHRRYISFKESFFAQMRNATPGPDLSELRREVTYLRQDLEEVRKENRSILPSVRLASAKGPTPRLASSASFTPFKKKAKRQWPLSPHKPGNHYNPSQKHFFKHSCYSQR